MGHRHVHEMGLHFALIPVKDMTRSIGYSAGIGLALSLLH